jgi:hypothetical protein
MSGFSCFKFRELHRKVGISQQENNAYPRCKDLNQMITLMKFGMNVVPLEDIPPSILLIFYHLHCQHVSCFCLIFGSMA